MIYTVGISCAPLPVALLSDHSRSFVVYHVSSTTTAHVTDRCPENLEVSVLLVQIGQTMTGLSWFLRRIRHMTAIPRYSHETVE